MTFDEYNTDENFDKKESSLDELVKLGVSEGKTSDEIKKSLSPKWQKSKKIGEFDTYYNNYTAPKVEPKTETKEEVKETVKTTTPTPAISSADKKYNDKVNAIADYQQTNETQKLQEGSEESFDRLVERMRKSSEAHKNINDHLIGQLPTFMFRRYQNGEFGDPKSEDAKLRLAYFMMNGLQSKLKNAANAASMAAGRGAMFSDTTSDYEKYQASNLQKGLEDRWRKYESETNEAIKLAQTHFDNEEDIDNTIRKISTEQRLQTGFNQMDANQKLYLMEVTKKIGDYLGDMDLSEVSDLMTGAAFSGTVSKDQAAAVCIAQLVKKTPKLMEQLPEGNMKNMVRAMIGGDPQTVVAGIGGAGGKTNSNGDQTNLTGNLQNYESIDGSNISFDFSDSKAKDKIQGELNKLTTKYKNGEIDAETFKKYYDPLYAEGKKHLGSIFSTPSSDKALSSANADVLTSLDEEFTNLNTQAKAGDLSPSAYQEQIAALTEKATKYGANKEMLKKIKDKTLSNEKILKAVDKKTKKK